MAGAEFIESLKNILGIGGNEEIDDNEPNQYNIYDTSDGYNDDYDGSEEEPAKRGGFMGILDGQKSKVVQMPQPQQIKMKIAKPTNFEQAEEIVKQLKMKNAVVMNLEYVSKDVARRIVDVVCGAVQALDGNMEKVSNSIFVVAPYNYDIISEITKEKIENKFASTWIK